MNHPSYRAINAFPRAYIYIYISRSLDPSALLSLEKRKIPRSYVPPSRDTTIHVPNAATTAISPGDVIRELSRSTSADTK